MVAPCRLTTRLTSLGPSTTRMLLVRRSRTFNCHNCNAYLSTICQVKATTTSRNSSGSAAAAGAARSKAELLHFRSQGRSQGPSKVWSDSQKAGEMVCSIESDHACFGYQSTEGKKCALRPSFFSLVHSFFQVVVRCWASCNCTRHSSGSSSRM